MSNLKDTDFDDLFRRASDKYPLRTASSDWDKMAAALERDPSPDTPDDADNTDKRRRRRFFWLFLLLPLAGIGYYLAHPTGPAGPATVTKTSTATSANADAAKVPAGSTNAPGATAPAPGATGATTAAGTAGATSATPGAAPKASAPGATRAPRATPNATASAPATSAGQAGAGIPRKVPGMVTSTNPKSQGKGIRSTGGDVPVRPNVSAAPTQTNTAEGNAVANATANETATARATANAANPVAAAFSLRSSPINQSRALTSSAYHLTVDVKAPIIQKDSAKKQASPRHKSSYLYAGILGAPDLSMVKFQSTKGVGSTLGILVGYAFNDRWAIETGAYVDRKRYYTEGEYFNTEKVYVPPNSQLLNVDGTCYMWEIPLNVRYNFNPAGKTRWFATAGLSTYLMSREDYTYAYKYAGPRTWNSSWDLKKPSHYPFSIVGASVGFEQRLGNVGNLRIEPYVRVPLSGIGTGKLPIMSTGINIGITRRLW